MPCVSGQLIAPGRIGAGARHGDSRCADAECQSVTDGILIQLRERFLGQGAVFVQRSKEAGVECVAGADRIDDSDPLSIDGNLVTSLYSR